MLYNIANAVEACVNSTPKQASCFLNSSLTRHARQKLIIPFIRRLPRQSLTTANSQEEDTHRRKADYYMKDELMWNPPVITANMT